MGWADGMRDIAMLQSVLVPEDTLATGKGDGALVDLSGASERTFLLILTIKNIIEQESLELSIFGSADGVTWATKPIASFPQKFYRGEYSFILDLRAHPDVKFVRARWDVARWGRGMETPMFEFGVNLKEIPEEIWRELSWTSTVAG